MATHDRSDEVVRYESREPYINGATVAAVQTVFNRSRLSHQGWESNQLHGRLDARRAWRSDAKGSVDIFRERRMPSPTRLNVHILVDASGSMQGARACRAQDMAGTLIEAFGRIPTVRIHVWQHNAIGAITHVYRNHAPGMPLNSLNRMLLNVGGGNADGFALDAIGQKVVETQRHDEKNLVIVISDGLPSVTGRGATGNILDHSTIVATDLRSRGIEVMSVAIAGDVASHKLMYGDDNVVSFSGDWNRLSQDFAVVFGDLLRNDVGTRW